jgi:mRNA interferase YafQ
MSYRIVTTSQFDADLKRIRKTLGRQAIIDIIDSLNVLASEGELPDEYKDHQLHDHYADEHEYHVYDDLLVIYHFNDSELTVVAVRSGSHQDLF